MHFVTQLLELPAFASGRVGDAYDELFGKPIGKNPTINLDDMKKKVVRNLPSGANAPTD